MGQNENAITTTCEKHNSIIDINCDLSSEKSKTAVPSSHDLTLTQTPLPDTTCTHMGHSSTKAEDADPEQVQQVIPEKVKCNSDTLQPEKLFIQKLDQICIDLSKLKILQNDLEN